MQIRVVQVTKDDDNCTDDFAERYKAVVEYWFEGTVEYAVPISSLEELFREVGGKNFIVLHSHLL